MPHSISILPFSRHEYSKYDCNVPHAATDICQGPSIKCNEINLENWEMLVNFKIKFSSSEVKICYPVYYSTLMEIALQIVQTLPKKQGQH